MDKIRAQEVLRKIDEILRWEAKVEEQKDQRFAELGKYLCEVRKQGYWRVGFRSFEHFLEAKFPDSRRKAYYLMSIHDHLKMIPTAEIEQLGWSKALELAKVARSEGRHFASATWLHRAKESTKQELKEEVYKYFSGEDYEPYEMVYFKLYESQLPVVERALVHISFLNPAWEPSDVRHHLYSCGYERDEDALEVETQWVRNKTSPFSSLLMPR